MPYQGLELASDVAAAHGLARYGNRGEGEKRRKRTGCGLGDRTNRATKYIRELGALQVCRNRSSALDTLNLWSWSSSNAVDLFRQEISFKHLREMSVCMVGKTRKVDVLFEGKWWKQKNRSRKMETATFQSLRRKGTKAGKEEGKRRLGEAASIWWWPSCGQCANLV